MKVNISPEKNYKRILWLNYMTETSNCNINDLLWDV